MTPAQRAEAHDILRDLSAPVTLRRHAWAALMQAKGCRVCQTNLIILARIHEHGAAAWGDALAPMRGAGATPEDAA